MNKLILHLGVHKTATTYVQSKIYNSREVLSQSGVGCISLDDTRRFFTSKITRSMTVTKEAKKFLDSHDVILLSDENILGGTDKITSQLIYPDGAERVKRLLEKLSPDSFELHLTIRDPEAYLVSRYCEYLRHYPFLDIHHYFDELFVKEFSWLPLINELQKVAGQRIKVTPFEDVFNDERAYFEYLIGQDLDLVPAADDPAVRRSKISQEAYETLLMVSHHFPGHMIRKMMTMIGNNKQLSRKTPLKPFSKQLSKRLRANYEADKHELGLT